MKLLALFFVSLLVVETYADDVRLDWVSEGFSAKLGYYQPMRATLSATKPVRVTRMPENVSNPLFGTIFFGPPEASVEVTILLDEAANGNARLWIDSNGNGDITDDPPVQWVGRQTKIKGKSDTMTSWSGRADIPVTYGNEKRTLGIKLYRFDNNDSQRQQLKNTLFYYRDCGFLGTISLNDKTYAAALVDDSARGDFSANTGVRLLIDLNNNGKFEFRDESFDVHKPFYIGGSTYEITGLTPRGGSFQLVKSSKTVAETTLLPVKEAGMIPIAFAETSTTGQSIRFPADYRGKLVMVDFWATWCGPCRAEAPNLAKVYEEFQPKGFEVIGVSLDNEQSIPKLAQFTADNHMPWPQIADGKGWEAKLAKQYGVHSIPAAWLIDGITGLIVAEGRDLRGAKLRPTIEHCLANLGKPSAISPSAAIQAPTGTATASGKPVIIRGSVNAGKGVTVLPSKLAAPEDPLVAKARELAKAGKLLTPAEFNSMLKSPSPTPIAVLDSDPGLIIDDKGKKPFMPALGAMRNSDPSLITDNGVKSPNPTQIAVLAAATQPLRGREIADRAAQAYVRAGWIYHCSKCDQWHVKLAGGYAIAKDTIVTAFHVMRTPDTIKQGEGYPVIIRDNDEFLYIVNVLAADETTDAIILRVAAIDLHPLAFSATARIGDAAYCFSDPRGTRGYFSSGIINRFYTRPGGSEDNPADQRFNVSTDWAPGSSGSAILDECANVIGHVAAIKPLLGANPSRGPDDHAGSTAPTLMTLHEAVSAGSILKLIEKTNTAAATK